MHVLGLSLFGPGTAAVLFVDGRLVAASAEERFTRVPHDGSFPEQAIRFCLDRAKTLTGQHDADRVAVVDWSDGRHGGGARLPMAGLRDAVIGWADKQSLRRRLRALTGVAPEGVLFVDAVRAHAANAFLQSPFETASVLVADGDAEEASTATGLGSGATLDLEAFARQPATADALARIAAGLAAQTGSTRLCVSGTCTGRIDAVAALLRSTELTGLFVPPAVDASGAALGAALHLSHVAGGQPRSFVLEHAYWGRSILQSAAVAAAEASDLTSVECDEDELVTRTAGLLTSGATVGWAQEAAEWGPRALGHRSVLRPAGIAPPPTAGEASLAVPAEHLGDFVRLDRPGDQQLARFAALGFDLRDEVREAIAPSSGAGPLVVHAVVRAANPRFHALLEQIGRIAGPSGVPALWQTPLARPGEPLANTAADAFAAISALELDALVVDRIVVIG